VDEEVEEENEEHADHLSSEVGLRERGADSERHHADSYVTTQNTREISR
jgi:hypothetical protein